MSLDKNLAKMQRLEEYPSEAILKVIEHGMAVIQLNQSPTWLRNVRIIGDPEDLIIGQSVSITWEERDGSIGQVPVVHSESPATIQIGSSMGIAVDDVTIEKSPYGIRVKQHSLTEGHMAYDVVQVGHTHEDSLERGGWQVTSDGVIFNNQTYISPNGMLSLGSGSDMLKLDSTHATYRIWAGAILPASAPFSVSKTGAIAATSGVIGGWTLGTDSLSSDSMYIEADDSSGDTPAIRMGSATAPLTGVGIFMGKDRSDPAWEFRVGDPADEYIHWDGTNLFITGTVRSADYAAGVSGWTIDADGDAEFANVRVRGTIRSAVFEYNEIQATGGTVMITKAAGKIHNDFTTPGSIDGTVTNIGIDDAESGSHLFANNDRVRIKWIDGSNTYDAWFIITAASDQGTYVNYTFQLKSGSTNAPVRAGQAVIAYNNATTASGAIYLSADNAIGDPPVIVLTTTNGAPWTDQVQRLRLGNLNGWGPYSTDIYGFAAGTWGGEYIRWDPTGGLEIAGDGDGITNIDGGNIQTNTVTATQIAANTITASQIAANTITAGEIAAGTITGTQLSIQTNISINSTTFATDGIQLQYNSGNPRFYCGDGSDNYLNFNGSTLSVSGNVSVNAGVITMNSSGLIVNASTSYLDSRSIRARYLSRDVFRLEGYGGTADYTRLVTGETTDSRNHYMTVATKSAQNYTARLSLETWSGGVDSAYISIEADYDGTDSIIGYAVDQINFATDGYVGMQNASLSPGRMRAKSGQFSTSWSGTPPDNGLLFYTDVTLYRSAANILRTGDTFQVDGDLYTASWASYSPTFNGWSSRSTTIVRRKKVGRLVFLAWRIIGTSSDNTCSFGLPYAAAAATGGDVYGMHGCTSGGTNSIGGWKLSGSTIYLYPDANYSSSWAGSGNAKNTSGFAVYEASS